MGMGHHPGRGTNSRKWPPGSSRENAPKDKKIFGVLYGRVRRGGGWTANGREGRGGGGGGGEGLPGKGGEGEVGEGGGRIIEGDSTISVNNPDAIRSWQRAAHWIGWISPPSVTSLQEWDPTNDFYHTGTSAFFRGWARSYLLSVRDIPSIRDRIGITSIPAGKNAQAATLGGFGLGISRSSRHTAEALQLIRFLIHREIEIEEARADYESQNWPELYDPTAILRVKRSSAETGKQQVSGVVARPSTVAGEKYEEVS